MILYEDLVQQMQKSYAEKTGAAAPEDSDTGVRFRVLAGELYSLWGGIEWLKASLLPQTAAGEELEKLAAKEGLSRIAAAKAVGKIRFTKTRESTIFTALVPAGTRCKTAGANPVVFETLEEAELALSGGATAEVAAQAVESGESGNVLAGAICTLQDANPYVAAVSNPAAFSGGRAQETDDELRGRLLAAQKAPQNGANAAFYRQLALGQAGVQSVCVQPAVPGRGEVTLWLAGAGAPAGSAAVKAVQDAAEKARELGSAVHVYPAKTEAVPLTVLVQKAAGQEDAAVQAAVKAAAAQCFAKLAVGEKMSAARLCAAVLQTSMVTDMELPEGTQFPAVPADTLTVLKGETEVEWI